LADKHKSFFDKPRGSQKGYGSRGILAEQKPMKITGPSPQSTYPIKGYTGLAFLNTFVKAANIIIGDYTYF